MGRQSKVVNLLVDTFGNYLGMDRGCVVLRDKERNEKKYPLFEDQIGEVVLTSGNTVNTQALSIVRKKKKNEKQKHNDLLVAPNMTVCQ